jgi:hypothetical protein
MLYIIKEVSDSYYLSSFEDKKEIVFTPIKSDALKLPMNIAKCYLNIINEIHGECEIISAKQID